MFSRKKKAERTAAQAWDYLSSAMASAAESAREAGKYSADVASAKASELSDAASRASAKLTGSAAKRSGRMAAVASRKAGKASSRIGTVSNEAWARANAAADALAGRKPGLPWGMIFGFSLIGVAIGWAAATTAKAALDRQAENEQQELAETAVIVTPS